MGTSPQPAPFSIPWISAAIGMSRFFGSLIIEPGSITFEPTSKLNEIMTAEAIRRVVHTEPNVCVVRARLLPPNLNSAVILRGDPSHGDSVTAGVQMPGWTRRRVKAALIAAGFGLDERVSWFSMGGGGSQWEVPPQRD